MPKRVEVSAALLKEIEGLTDGVAIAAIRAWLKSRQLESSAGSKTAIAQRLAANVASGKLTIGEVKDFLIGVEESAAKRVYLFRISDQNSKFKLKSALVEADIPLEERRLASPKTVSKPKAIYATVDGNRVRVKWAEMHTALSIDPADDSIRHTQFLKSIVLTADLSEGTCEIRYDKPERKHPHAKGPGIHNPDLYVDAYVSKASTLLGCTLTKSELRPVLKKLVTKVPRIIRLHRDEHTNQFNNAHKTVSHGGDVRDDEDWIAMHKNSGQSWAYDAHSFHWLPSPDKRSLARELFSHIDADQAMIRFKADCNDDEISYAVKKIRELEE